jgi:cytidylate kinase
VRVITVSRQYGSGGSVIAKMVADRLDWTIVDNDFVDRVAERVGLPPEEVAEREERVATLIERLASTLAISSPELFIATSDLSPEATRSTDEIVHMTEAVIQEAVEHGTVVLVGRGAQAYLANRDATLHVRIVAPRDDRVRASAGRKEYVHTHYQRDWDDPCNYHLIVNSALVSYEGAADLIIAAATRTAG